MPGLGAGRRRHPVDLGQPPVEGGGDVAHHPLHVGAGRGREILLDVELADRVAQRGAGGGQGAALARPLRLLAGEGAAVKAEAQIVIGAGQDGGHAAGGVEGQPVLPGLDRLAADQGRKAGDRRRVPGHELLLAGRAGPR